MARIKILVVEDEQLVADDLQETLTALGYDVAGLAATGEGAIAQAITLHPDLVLMDIRLNGALDGITAATQIQSQLRIPIVYLTANADLTTLERAKATRPFGYILKPFDDRTLAITLEIALARHQAEVEMQQALTTSIAEQRAAEITTQRKSQSLSRLSHELRNPLTTIQFALVALQQSRDQVSEIKRQVYCQRIQDAIHNLSYLLETILSLEKVGAGHTPLHLTAVDLVQFCQDQLEMLQFSAGHRYALNFISPCAACMAILDETLFWHLLNNLIANAVKYSPPGGPITLTFIPAKTDLTFQVIDRGMGIPAADLPQLFEPFHRGGNVAEIPGTGLGLAIAKEYAELLGGEISVVSILGQGSTFTVRLPWRKD